MGNFEICLIQNFFSKHLIVRVNDDRVPLKSRQSYNHFMICFVTWRMKLGHSFDGNARKRVSKYRIQISPVSHLAFRISLPCAKL